MPNIDFNLSQYERIHQYKDILKNSKEIIELLDNDDSKIFDSKWKWYSTKPILEEIEPYKIHTYEFTQYKKFNKDGESSLYREIDTLINIVTQDYSKTHNIPVKEKKELIFHKSYPGKHMGPHVDSHGKKDSPKLSVILEFNDDIKGGEVLFRKQKVMIKPSVGSIIIYPSVEPFYHQPNLIKHGIKYTAHTYWY
jgi:hypothetical protein